MQKTSKKSVPVKEKLACGAGEVANRFGENGVNDPVMNIYTLILGASPATIGLILSIQKIWDAISDPIMGYVSDNWKGKKNLILITHYVVILETLDKAVSSGEIVISDKSLNVVGSIINY